MSPPTQPLAVPITVTFIDTPSSLAVSSTIFPPTPKNLASQAPPPTTYPTFLTTLTNLSGTIVHRLENLPHQRYKGQGFTLDEGGWWYRLVRKCGGDDHNHDSMAADGEDGKVKKSNWKLLNNDFGYDLMIGELTLGTGWAGASVEVQHDLQKRRDEASTTTSRRRADKLGLLMRRRASSAPPPPDRDPLEPEGNGISLAEACTSSNTPTIDPNFSSELRPPTKASASAVAEEAFHSGDGSPLADDKFGPISFVGGAQIVDAPPVTYDFQELWGPRVLEATGPLIVTSPLFGPIRDGSCTPETEQDIAKSMAVTTYENVATSAVTRPEAAVDCELTVEPSSAYVMPTIGPAGMIFPPAYNASYTAHQRPSYEPSFKPPPQDPPRAHNSPRDRYHQPVRSSSAMIHPCYPSYTPRPGPFPAQIGAPTHETLQQHTGGRNYPNPDSGAFRGRGKFRSNGQPGRQQGLSIESEMSMGRSSASPSPQSPAQLMYQQHQQYQQQHGGTSYQHQQQAFHSACTPSEQAWLAAKDTEGFEDYTNMPYRRSVSDNVHIRAPNFDAPYGSRQKNSTIGGRRNNGKGQLFNPRSGVSNSHGSPSVKMPPPHALKYTKVHRDSGSKILPPGNQLYQEPSGASSGLIVDNSASSTAISAQTDTSKELDGQFRHRRKWSQTVPLDTSRGIVIGRDDDNDIVMADNKEVMDPSVQLTLLPKPKVAMPPLGDFSPPKPRKNGQAFSQVLGKVMKSNGGTNGSRKAETPEDDGRNMKVADTEDVRKVEKGVGQKAKKKKGGKNKNKHGHATDVVG